ncbi:MAG: hypothetical protein WCH46_00840 [bacterium]
MSKLETPMIIRYWENNRGTLIEEFQLVARDGDTARRRADAIIIKNEEHKQIPKGQRNISLEGKDIIVVQAKARRLGMNVMGQAVFSRELLLKFHKPKSVTSVILCREKDPTLEAIILNYPGIKVITTSENK